MVLLDHCVAAGSTALLFWSLMQWVEKLGIAIA